MWTPTSCSSAPYSSHSRSRSPSPCDAARLVEDARATSLRDLLRVLRPVAAALAELDDAAAPDVGIALDLADARAVAVDVVEHEPFAQGEIAERELARRRGAGGSCRAGPSPATARSARRGSMPGRREPLLEVRRRRDAFAAGAGLLALTRRLRTSSGGSPSSVAARSAPEAEDRARRADHALEALAGDLIDVGARSRG